jgi:hypothetical protein
MKDLCKQSRTRHALIESIPNDRAMPILSDEAVFALAVEGHQS